MHLQLGIKSLMYFISLELKIASEHQRISCKDALQKRQKFSTMLCVHLLF